MKTKIMLFTLLIGMIGFAGFSQTTTDLKQDSNYEIVTPDMVVSNHSVVILSVDAEIVLNHDAVILDLDSNSLGIYPKKAFLNKNLKFEPDKYLVSKNYQDEDKKTMQFLKRSTLPIYRLARDGFRNNV